MHVNRLTMPTNSTKRVAISIQVKIMKFNLFCTFKIIFPT